MDKTSEAVEGDHDGLYSIEKQNSIDKDLEPWFVIWEGSVVHICEETDKSIMNENAVT